MATNLETLLQKLETAKEGRNITIPQSIKDILIEIIRVQKEALDLISRSTDDIDGPISVDGETAQECNAKVEALAKGACEKDS